MPNIIDHRKEPDGSFSVLLRPDYPGGGSLDDCAGNHVADWLSPVGLDVWIWVGGQSLVSAEQAGVRSDCYVIP